jgi:RNA polymerase sigma factor FliA
MELDRYADRNKIVLGHLDLVKVTASNIHSNLPACVCLDDLINSGIFGLMEAAEKYDPQRGVKFSTYARHRIRGAILDSLRGLDSVTRYQRKEQKKVLAATCELEAELQRRPTEVEIAQRLDWSLDELRKKSIDLRTLGPVSTTSYRGSDNDMPPPDIVDASRDELNQVCMAQGCSFVNQAMGVLPERYQRVVKLYYEDEMTMKEIGQILGVNEGRISQIHKASIEKMGIWMNQHNLTSIHQVL